MQPTRVTIAVLTFHRPHHIQAAARMLVEQAEEVCAQPGDPPQGAGFDVEVLVVDNDPAGSARQAVAAVGAPRLRYVIEAHPGIAAARNRAIAEAAGRDLLVFIDDDGRPAPGWLAALLVTWSRERPAAVAGRVTTTFEGEPHPWLVEGEFFRRRNLSTGTCVPDAPSGNLLLDLHQLGDLRFETGLGLSGGEDSLLTRSLVKAGGRIVFCAEAEVIDIVAAGRSSRRWIAGRALSHGNTTGTLQMYLDTGSVARSRAITTAHGLARSVAGAAQFAAGVVRRSTRWQARGARTGMRGVGMVVAAAGITYQEYGSAVGWRRFVRTPPTLAPGAHTRAVR